MATDLSSKVDGFVTDVRSILGVVALGVVWLIATLGAITIALSGLGAGSLLTSLTSNAYVAALVAKASDPVAAAFAFLFLALAVLIADKGIRVFKD